MNKFLVSALCIVTALCFAANAFAFSSFKFAAIADPHMSVASSLSPDNGVKMFKDSVKLLQATIEDINKHGDIDFTVALGDLTKDAEPWNVDRFKEVMDELKMPWYVVLGNHDISPIDTNKADRSPGVTRSNMIWTFQGHGYNGPGTHWGLDPLPNVHLVGLDSSITGDWGGRITQTGLDFLKKDLAVNPDKFTILLLHHQLTAYTEPEKTGENDFDKFVLDNADEVKSILKQNPQVAVTLSGHRHISTRYIKEDHAAMFTLPSTMTWPMRYVVFEVNRDKIAYKTYDVPCDPETWEEAKKYAMSVSTKQWPRTSLTPDTAEGNKRLTDEMLGVETMSGIIPLDKKMFAVK